MDDTTEPATDPGREPGTAGPGAPGEPPLTAVALGRAAGQLAWRSRVLGRVGTSAVKVLRMSELPLAEERHESAEALLVLDGLLALEVRGEPVDVRAGELFLVPAGAPHRVRPREHGNAAGRGGGPGAGGVGASRGVGRPALAGGGSGHLSVRPCRPGAGPGRWAHPVGCGGTPPAGGCAPHSAANRCVRTVGCAPSDVHATHTAARRPTPSTPSWPSGTAHAGPPSGCPV
ncbi:cupin domain-containing protein [Streptomyces sp. 71268]|uniref:cupin domain-containing protein n=1 Tax=Streptomyces sp. 71268 TaxID=3002640 RepID=UPI0032B217F0